MRYPPLTVEISISVLCCIVRSEPYFTCRFFLLCLVGIVNLDKIIFSCPVEVADFFTTAAGGGTPQSQVVRITFALAGRCPESTELIAIEAVVQVLPINTGHILPGSVKNVHGLGHYFQITGHFLLQTQMSLCVLHLAANATCMWTILRKVDGVGTAFACGRPFLTLRLRVDAFQF